MRVAASVSVAAKGSTAAEVSVPSTTAAVARTPALAVTLNAAVARTTMPSMDLSVATEAAAAGAPVSLATVAAVNVSSQAADAATSLRTHLVLALASRRLAAALLQFRSSATRLKLIGSSPPPSSQNPGHATQDLTDGSKTNHLEITNQPPTGMPDVTDGSKTDFNDAIHWHRL